MSTDTRLAADDTALLMLIEMQFTTGTWRMTNWTHNLPWMGQTWLGLGAVVSLSGMTEAERLEYPSFDIGLNPGKTTNLALALGNSSVYRGRPVTVWAATLDEQLRPDGDPFLFWAGVMDQVRWSTGDGQQSEAVVMMRCENPSKDKRAAQNLRLNHAQQDARYPGDTGLSRLEQMTGQPQTWLTQRFQKNAP